MKKTRCDAPVCWICEKAQARVSLDFHDYIMKQSRINADYSLGFSNLAKFIIGEEEVSKIFDGYTERWGGSAQKASAQIMAKAGRGKK